ncbi:MAG: hypothetical protein FJZ10_06465 [Candidatus Omnitrophica bacterium]|nr:hypothetical protein [Candidatus Omnitrophota bacterium]
MPFSFIEIEQKKSRLIFFVFLVLIVFYFLTVWLILLIVRNLFFANTYGQAFRFGFPPLNNTFIAFVIAFFIGLFHWSFSTSNLIDKISASIDAIPVDTQDTYHQYLKNIVDEVSVAIGGRQIEAYVIPTPALNAYSLVDFKDNAVIGVTEGLLARLNRSQIEAVVGHEAGHIVSGDSFNTTVICSLSEIYKESVLKLGRGMREVRFRGKGGALILLIYVVLALMNFLNQLLHTFISRQREYRSDAIAVRLTRNPLALAEALKLISEKWNGSSINGENLESIFIVSPRYNMLDEGLGLVPNLFATHPPIQKRIAILLDMAHMDEKTLEENIKNMKRVSPVAKAEFKDTKPSQQKRWLVFRENQWQGPFLLDELRKLEGLLPTNWIRQEGQDTVFEAFNDEDVARVFGEKDGRDKESCPCPHCHTNLSQLNYEGTPILKCDYCEGSFVDYYKVSRIFIREDKEFTQDIIELADSVYKTKLKYNSFSKPEAKNDWILDCPKCHKKMHRQFFVYSYPVEIDRCPSCSGIWFDKQELEALQYIYQNKDKFIDGKLF